MPAGGFELRDHTADIALCAWGESLAELFRAAAGGLYATIGEIETTVSRRTEPLRLEAGDAESLLHDFLAELLYRFETKGEMLTQVNFTRLDERVLEATMHMARVDETRSVLDREVKAVTYHDINIEHRDGRYEVTLILDI